MSNKITYKLKSNDKTNLINVPIGDDFFPVDNTELVDKEVEKTVQRSINNISDWEKTIYRIVCNDQSEGQCINLDFNLWDDTIKMLNIKHKDIEVVFLEYHILQHHIEKLKS